MPNKVTFLETNDIHWRVANPRARMDSYYMAIEKKLTEIFELARKMDADAILVPGDITDTPGLGLAALAELACLLSRTPCPILTIAGQHDEWGAQPRILEPYPIRGTSPTGIYQRRGHRSRVLRGGG